VFIKPLNGIAAVFRLPVEAGTTANDVPALTCYLAPRGVAWLLVSRDAEGGPACTAQFHDDTRRWSVVVTGAVGMVDQDYQAAIVVVY
jgi:hypothetical protein